MQITSGRMIKPLKCVVYGPEGIGKSTFASLAPYPLFCDVEDSTVHMDVRRLPKASSHQMILEEIAYVRANPSLCDTFVLDTADWAERICRENVCAKNGKSGIEDFGYGKGYSYVYEDFGKILNALDELLLCGINVIVTAHAIMRKFEQPDEMGAYDRWELKLNNSPKCSISNMLKEWADLVLFANYETIVVKNEDKKNKAQGGKRVMYTTHHPCWDAKNRFGLPDKLPFEFGQIAGLFLSKSAMQGKPVTLPDGGRQVAAPTVVGGNTCTGRAESSVPTGAKVNGENPKRLGICATGTEGNPPALRATSLEREADRVVEEFPVITDDEGNCPFEVQVPLSVHKPLADLMRQNAVAVEELQGAVGVAGYFPADMPITAYPMDFQMYLTTVWDKVLTVIKNNQKKER